MCFGKFYWMLVLCLLTSCLKPNEDNGGNGNNPGTGQNTYNWTAIADSAQTSLNLFWNGSERIFTNTNTTSAWVNYWPTAHALDVLIDLYLRNPSPSLKARMDDVLEGLRIRNGGSYINFYYDDMQWLALACLRAFQATGDARYRNVVDILWADIKNGWSSDLGGGIWWRKDNSSKNAPSNLPAAILAARLYKQFNRSEDLDWARRIYDWQKANLYDANTGWVYDNIERNGNKNTTWRFTYNQGTWVGAAMELFSITNNTSYLNDAIKGIEFTLQSGQLTDVANGILRDEGGGDGGLFKGVFVRYFTRFIVADLAGPQRKTQYINFMRNNAQVLWSRGTNKNLVLFGSAWNQLPGGSVDLTIQLSGIMLMEAMAELKKLKLVD